MELLTGKILGIAAVGLTQIFVWLTMVGIVGAFGAAVAVDGGRQHRAVHPPDASSSTSSSSSSSAYLTYVCVYAIAGAVCNSEKEAQQFIMPIMMLMMMPWILMMPIVTESRRAVRGRLLALAGLRPDDDVRPHAGHRAAAVAHPGLDRRLHRHDPGLLLGHRQDLPRRHPLVRQSGPTIPELLASGMQVAWRRTPRR